MRMTSASTLCGPGEEVDHTNIRKQGKFLIISLQFLPYSAPEGQQGEELKGDLGALAHQKRQGQTSHGNWQ